MWSEGKTALSKQKEARQNWEYILYTPVEMSLSFLMTVLSATPVMNLPLTLRTCFLLKLFLLLAALTPAEEVEERAAAALFIFIETLNPVPRVNSPTCYIT